MNPKEIVIIQFIGLVMWTTALANDPGLRAILRRVDWRATLAHTVEPHTAMLVFPQAAVVKEQSTWPTQPLEERPIHPTRPTIPTRPSINARSGECSEARGPAAVRSASPAGRFLRASGKAMTVRGNRRRQSTRSARTPVGLELRTSQMKGGTLS